MVSQGLLVYYLQMFSLTIWISFHCLTMQCNSAKYVLYVSRTEATASLNFIFYNYCFYLSAACIRGSLYLLFIHCSAFVNRLHCNSNFQGGYYIFAHKRGFFLRVFLNILFAVADISPFFLGEGNKNLMKAEALVMSTLH